MKNFLREKEKLKIETDPHINVSISIQTLFRSFYNCSMCSQSSRKIISMECIKIFLIKILEMKTIMQKMKYALDGINGRLDVVGKEIS